MKHLLRFLKLGVPIALAVWLMYITFDTQEKRDGLLAAMQQMDWTYLILAVIFAWVSHLIRARRWQYLMEPLGYGTRLWTRYHAVMAGYLINMAIPRAGEASRAALTAKYENTPFDKTFGTIAAERIVDLIILATITGLTVISQYDIIWERMAALMSQTEGAEPSDNTMTYLIIGGVVLAGLLAFRFLGLQLRDKIVGFLRGIWEGLTAILKTPDKGRFILDTVLIWVLYLLMFILPFFAMEETSVLGPGAIMAAFVFGAFSVVLTPGGTGTYHWAVGLALGYYGIAESSGQALGLVIWASQAIMLIVAGAISLALIPIYNRAYPGHTPHPVS